MLTTISIPQYEEKDESWTRFLYKAGRGSAKATDILSNADMSYMVTLTNDSESPSTLDLKKYHLLFRNVFPNECPFTTQEIIDFGVDSGWFPHGFVVTGDYRKENTVYENLWESNVELNWTVLINDAAQHCVENWSADDALKLCNISNLDFNAKLVVSAMLYLSLTWPD